MREGVTEFWTFTDNGIAQESVMRIPITDFKRPGGLERLIFFSLVLKLLQFLSCPSPNLLLLLQPVYGQVATEINKC